MEKDNKEISHRENYRIAELEDLVEDLSSSLAENFYKTLQILQTFTTFIEKYYEGSHSRFVAEKSSAIAEDLGLPEEEVMEVRIAALLHDIGKIGFSDNMLFKYTSEMSSAEKKAYERHSQMGMELLKPHSAFSEISKIIYHHHEKLDGSGFPNFLKGNEIHPGAKIIGVVDYFHNSVYKRLRNRSESDSSSAAYTSTTQMLQLTKERYNHTMNYLLKKSGVLFERKVVKLFIEMMEIERRSMGNKSVMRVPVNKIETGMILAEDYHTSYGMLIAAKGETVSEDMKKALLRFVDAGELPNKILTIK